MTTAIIVTIYKDYETLNLIIEAIRRQTILPSEIIIAEDNNSEYVANLVKNLNINNIFIQHTSHPDNGWQRNKSSNNALRVAKSDYLIWIDGDCIPFPTLIESHIALCENNTVLCGRRTEPGENFSLALKTRKITVENFLDNYFINYFKLKKDKIRHYDEGIYFQYNSFVWKLIHYFRNKENHIVGCHWSCWKNDLENINGFDEDFRLPTIGEDSDIERRFRYFGVKMKSCKYCANVIHLYHEKVFNPKITLKTEKMMYEKKDIYICKKGLNK